MLKSAKQDLMKKMSQNATKTQRKRDRSTEKNTAVGAEQAELIFGSCL